MPLVAAALAPNSPLLLPGLNTQARAAVAKTTGAMAALAAKLMAHSPDVILLVAGATDTTSVSHNYSLLQAPKFSYEFGEFGDLTTSGAIRIAMGLTHRLKEKCETQFPIPLLSQNSLPYSFAVPVVTLGPAIANVPLICLQLPREVPLDDLQRLAAIVDNQFTEGGERVAIIGAGLLARRQSEEDTDAPIFDKQFQAAVLSTGSDALLNLDTKLRSRVTQSLWGPAALLYTILSARTLKAEMLSYESPFGVGFITTYIDLS